jgi:hypothetical protein
MECWVAGSTYKSMAGTVFQTRGLRLESEANVSVAAARAGGLSPAGAGRCNWWVGVCSSGAGPDGRRSAVCSTSTHLVGPLPDHLQCRTRGGSRVNELQFVRGERGDNFSLLAP